MYRRMKRAESRFIFNYLSNHLDDMDDHVLVFRPRLDKYQWLPLAEVGEDPLDSDVLVTAVDTAKIVKVIKKDPANKKKLQSNLFNTLNANEDKLLKGYHFKQVDKLSVWVKKMPYTPMIVEALMQGSHKVTSLFLGQHEDGEQVDQLLKGLPVAEGLVYYQVYPMQKVQVDA